MSLIEVEATLPGPKGADGKPDTTKDKKCVVNIEFGDNLKDAVAKFGEEVVFTNYRQQAVIRAQAAIRGRLKSGNTNDQIIKDMTGYKPGVGASQRSAVDPITALTAEFATAKTAEEKAAIRKRVAELVAAMK